MKRVWQIFKQHPIAIIAYILYAFFCYNVARNILWFHHNMKINPEGSGISNGGEVVGYGMFFIFLLAIIYGVIIFINALVKTHTQFYWWFLLAILIPIIALVNL